MSHKEHFLLSGESMESYPPPKKRRYRTWVLKDEEEFFRPRRDGNSFREGRRADAKPQRRGQTRNVQAGPRFSVWPEGGDVGGRDPREGLRRMLEVLWCHTGLPEPVLLPTKTFDREVGGRPLQPSRDKM